MSKLKEVYFNGNRGQLPKVPKNFSQLRQLILVKYPELSNEEYTIDWITARGDREVNSEHTFEVLHRLEAGPLGFIIRQPSIVPEEFHIRSTDLIGLRCIFSWYFQVHKYDPLTCKYIRTELNLNLGIQYVVIQDGIFLTGGYNGEEKKARVFDGTELVPHNDMKKQHCWHSMVTLEEKVYVLGGTDDINQVHQFWEYYDKETQLWRLVSKMCEKRRKPAACIFHDNIYLFGGGPNTIEFFNGKKWQILSFQLDFPINGAGACVVNDSSVIIFGGDQTKASYIVNLTNSYTQQVTDVPEPGFYFYHPPVFHDNRVMAWSGKCSGIYIYRIQDRKWFVSIEQRWHDRKIVLWALTQSRILNEALSREAISFV